MARTSAILTPSDKKAKIAAIKTELKSLKVVHKDALSAIKTLDKEYKTKLTAANKAAAVADKQLQKVQSQLDALAA